MVHKVKRVFRNRRLTREEVERDEDVRRKVQEEFPPAHDSAAIPGSLSETLKKAIRHSNMSVYQIAKDAEVSQIVLSRFLSGERDIRMATADKLAAVLGLSLHAGQ